ncbi:hypothetical protein CVT26_007299 [Gymnopilus dilepis]|uniref:Uncharacterized protein n=1 Tax=Gymnopilus dilepis TaxID=231916 RepID=A0A409VLZ0_9AGAR|nr:hypothetical protein CVT26_007299 [Gymnopilus dilepis]
MASREIFLILQDDVNAIPPIEDAAVSKALLHSVIEHIIQLKHLEYRLVVVVRQAVNIARIMFVNTEGQTWNSILVDIDNFVRRNTRHRFRNILKRIFFPDQDPIYPEYFALNERLVALSQSLQARCEDATGNESPGGPSSHNHITSFFAGASNILVQHSTFVQAQGDFVLQEIAESQGLLKGLPVIAREDIAPIREVYRGRDHKLHVARIVSGRVVTMKVYEDRNAKEVGVIYSVTTASYLSDSSTQGIHTNGEALPEISVCLNDLCTIVLLILSPSSGPDVLHLVAVSSSSSWLPFLVFDGVYEGTAVAAIGLALEKSLKESLMMGMETVSSTVLFKSHLLMDSWSTKSGLEHLQIIGYPFEYAGEEHFSLLRNTDGRVMISFEAPSTTVTTPAGFDQQNEETAAFHAPLKIFHTLCRKVGTCAFV